MQCTLLWNEKMLFTAAAGGHEVAMDAKPPFGQGKAQTPKQLLLAALCGCTAMDVVALLRRHKQDLKSLEVHAEASESAGGHPVVLTAVELVFRLQGTVDGQIADEAVRLSQTQYCGVSAMLSRALPIRYAVFVNGVEVGRGAAAFGPGS